jgi:hypothetical protein
LYFLRPRLHRQGSEVGVSVRLISVKAGTTHRPAKTAGRCVVLLSPYIQLII